MKKNGSLCNEEEGFQFWDDSNFDAKLGFDIKAFVQQNKLEILKCEIHCCVEERK